MLLNSLDAEQNPPRKSCPISSHRSEERGEES